MCIRDSITIPKVTDDALVWDDWTGIKNFITLVDGSRQCQLKFCETRLSSNRTKNLTRAKALIHFESQSYALVSSDPRSGACYCHMSTDRNFSVGDGHCWWAHYSRLADTSTNEEDAAELLGWIEKATDDNIISVCWMMSMMTGRKVYKVLGLKW